MAGSNPSLSCNIDSSAIAVNDYGRAFFEDITVTLNGENSTLLNTAFTKCRVQDNNLYTVMCFHDDHTREMEEGSGGSTTLLIVLACVILILIGIAIVLFSKLRREREALEKERSDHEETKKLLEEQHK